MTLLHRRGLNRRALTEDQVVQILTSDARNSAIAREFGLTAETIRRVRQGQHYAEIRPDIPRWEPKPQASQGCSCWNCIHHRTYMVQRNDGSSSTERAVRCGIGLPDPLHHGPRFAAMCASFIHQDHARLEMTHG